MTATAFKKQLHNKKEQATLMKFSSVEGESKTMPHPEYGVPMEAVEVLEWATLFNKKIANSETMELTKQYYLEFVDLFSYKIQEA